MHWMMSLHTAPPRTHARTYTHTHTLCIHHCRKLLPSEGMLHPQFLHTYTLATHLCLRLLLHFRKLAYIMQRNKINVPLLAAHIIQILYHWNKCKMLLILNVYRHSTRQTLPLVCTYKYIQVHTYKYTHT